MKFTKKDVPADVLAKLDKITKMVSDGQIVPPTKVEDVAAFQPPLLTDSKNSETQPGGLGYTIRNHAK